MVTNTRQPATDGPHEVADSGIADVGALAWTGDFLGAAYYRRNPSEREIDDLRLASCILATYWYRASARGRLREADLHAFERAFGAERIASGSALHGTLSRDQLLAGAARLIGDWFPDAYADDRRAWGIAFETLAARAAYDPRRRWDLMRVGALAPERGPVERRLWRPHPAVEMPSADAALGALARTEAWPDYASEVGRLTPLRSGGLRGQTFEVELVAGTTSGRPIISRGFVSITSFLTTSDPAALRRWFTELEDGLARCGGEQPQTEPYGSRPIAGIELTAHAGALLGCGRTRLLLYGHAGGAWLRAVGTWDPPSNGTVERLAAMAALWGDGSAPERSMLHQLALSIA